MSRLTVSRCKRKEIRKMANCKACNDLRTNAPNVLVNGIDDTACTSLKNNTGLNPSTSTDDCADLENLNDCLVRNMEEEIDAYDVCDWKDFMKRFIPNVYNVMAGIICAICGLWTNIKNIWTKINYLLCVVENLTKDLDFQVTQDNIKWFNGVTARTEGETVAVPSITGNAYCGYLTGSIKLPDDFGTRFPNENLNTNGALLYEYRIKMSDFKLRKIYNGNLQENASGQCVHAHIFKFTSNSPTRPYGPGNTGYADYTVPEGWTYLQIRMSSYEKLPSSGNMTLSGVIPVLMNPNSFDC